MLEIIVLDKYLIRGLDNCYGLSKVKDGKQPIILKNSKLKKVDGVEMVVEKSNYSNFGDETFPSTFANCLKNIIDEEVRYSNITGSGLKPIYEIVGLLDEIHSKISRIDDVFQTMRKK